MSDQNLLKVKKRKYKRPEITVIKIENKYSLFMKPANSYVVINGCLEMDFYGLCEELKM